MIMTRRNMLLLPIRIYSFNGLTCKTLLLAALLWKLYENGDIHKIYFKHMLNLFLYLIANLYLGGALAWWLGRWTLYESNFVGALEYSTN